MAFGLARLFHLRKMDTGRHVAGTWLSSLVMDAWYAVSDLLGRLSWLNDVHGKIRLCWKVSTRRPRNFCDKSLKSVTREHGAGALVSLMSRKS